MSNRKDDRPYLAPLCYVCRRRRSTRRDNCCDACRDNIRAHGGRLPGASVQPGYSPGPKPAPPAQLGLFPSVDEGA